MINTSDRPIVLLDRNLLDQEVRDAINWAVESVRDQQRNTTLRESVKTVVPRILGEKNRRRRHFDRSFLSAAYDFANTDAQHSSAQQALGVLAGYLKQFDLTATMFAPVKRTLKLALVELWRRGALLLPTVFLPGSGFEMRNVRHELIQWLMTFDPASTAGIQATSDRRMYHYGPRLVLATNWIRVEDVSLVDIAKLHLAQLRHSRGLHPHAIAGSQFPWSQFSAELLKKFPRRVGFTEADLVNYSSWSALNATERGDLKDFDASVSKPKRRAVQRTQSKALGTGPKARKTEDLLENEARNAATHDAALGYFKRLSKRPPSVDWRISTPIYPGREHIDLNRLCKRWVESFNEFLYHREYIQGYRSANEVVASLNLLSDYLFGYLPWWRELFPMGDVDVPRVPKEFLRVAYVSRHSGDPIEKLPATLLELIRLRRPKAESAAICIKHLTLYFRFVKAHYGDDEEMAGPAFRIPLDDAFDTPRIPNKKNKTNKEIIPRNIYGHLLFYCYALEDFGIHLLKRVIEGSLGDSWTKMRGALRYETARFGLIPIVRYRGREMPLRSVPNVFTWAERLIAGEDGRALVVPHLTALRLLIVSLETGLRCQSVQWLDRMSWDSLNTSVGEQYTYRLLVNTDKTKVEAWSPPVVFRVRHVLQREVAFQELFADCDSFAPVPYEGVPNSPFAPIRPLFKSHSSGRPIRDSVYYDAWLAIQVDFASFYKEETGEKHVRLHHVKAIRSSDGQPVIKYSGRNENPYCAVSILPVHTPHSCRATFATNRQGQGILELSDVAELLGHEGVATTAHYTKFSSEQLRERLERSDVALLGDYSIFDVGGESAYVRPDKPDSALRQGFEKDREGAVEAFRFMPSMALWSIEENKLDESDGLKLLKSGPMSHIRFRETHICPVGEECPSEIVRQIGAPRRCGICPLAMKCIDHLPPIAAKRNQLVERIRYLFLQRKRMEDAGEPSGVLDAVWDEMQLDINELLGWKFSEEVLRGMHVEAEKAGDVESVIHVGRPDIVRRHLRLVMRQCDRTEFLLQRLAESNAYPSMSSPQVQLAASVLRRRLSAGQGLEDFGFITSEGDDVSAAASMLRTMMKASGVGVKEVAALLTSPVRTSAVEPVLLHAEKDDGE